MKANEINKEALDWALRLLKPQYQKSFKLLHTEKAKEVIKHYECLFILATKRDDEP